MKNFIIFFHEAAQGVGIPRNKMQDYVEQEFDNLRFAYIRETRQAWICNNVPKLKKQIVSSYLKENIFRRIMSWLFK